MMSKLDIERLQLLVESLLQVTLTCLSECYGNNEFES